MAGAALVAVMKETVADSVSNVERQSLALNLRGVVLNAAMEETMANSAKNAEPLKWK